MANSNDPNLNQDRDPNAPINNPDLDNTTRRRVVVAETELEVERRSFANIAAILAVIIVAIVGIFMFLYFQYNSTTVVAVPVQGAVTTTVTTPATIPPS